jgi:hypothetical protein
LKVRDIGMPEEGMWADFFNVDLILSELMFINQTPNRPVTFRICSGIKDPRCADMSGGPVKINLTLMGSCSNFDQAKRI